MLLISSEKFLVLVFELGGMFAFSPKIYQGHQMGHDEIH